MAITHDNTYCSQAAGMCCNLSKGAKVYYYMENMESATSVRVSVSVLRPRGSIAWISSSFGLSVFLGAV